MGQTTSNPGQHRHGSKLHVLMSLQNLLRLPPQLNAPQPLPLASYFLPQKDQLLLYWIFKVLTHDHCLFDDLQHPKNEIPAQEDSTVIIKLKQLPAPLVYSTHPPLSLYDDDSNTSDYMSKIDILHKLINIYLNTKGLLPNDASIVQAMYKVFDDHAVEVNFPVNEPTISINQLFPHANAAENTPEPVDPLIRTLLDLFPSNPNAGKDNIGEKHYLKRLLTRLCKQLPTYTHLPLLTSYISAPTLNQLLNDFGLDKENVHELYHRDYAQLIPLHSPPTSPTALPKISENGSTDIMSVYKPMQFITNIHLSVLMLLSSFVPSLSSSIHHFQQTILSTNSAPPDFPHAPTNIPNANTQLEFFTAMQCVYNHLVALCVILLCPSPWSQLDLLDYYPQSNNPVINRNYMEIIQQFPFLWILSEITPAPADQHKYNNSDGRGTVVGTDHYQPRVIKRFHVLERETSQHIISKENTDAENILLEDFTNDPENIKNDENSTTLLQNQENPLILQNEELIAVLSPTNQLVNHGTFALSTALTHGSDRSSVSSNNSLPLSPATMTAPIHHANELSQYLPAESLSIRSDGDTTVNNDKSNYTENKPNNETIPHSHVKDNIDTAIESTRSSFDFLDEEETPPKSDMDLKSVHSPHPLIEERISEVILSPAVVIQQETASTTPSNLSTEHITKASQQRSVSPQKQSQSPLTPQNTQNIVEITEPQPIKQIVNPHTTPTDHYVDWYCEYHEMYRCDVDYYLQSYNNLLSSPVNDLAEDTKAQDTDNFFILTHNDEKNISFKTHCEQQQTSKSLLTGSIYDYVTLYHYNMNTTTSTLNHLPHQRCSYIYDPSCFTSVNPQLLESMTRFYSTIASVQQSASTSQEKPQITYDSNQLIAERIWATALNTVHNSPKIDKNDEKLALPPHNVKLVYPFTDIPQIRVVIPFPSHFIQNFTKLIFPLAQQQEEQLFTNWNGVYSVNYDIPHEYTLNYGNKQLNSIQKTFHITFMNRFIVYFMLFIHKILYNSHKHIDMDNTINAQEHHFNTPFSLHNTNITTTALIPQLLSTYRQMKETNASSSSHNLSPVDDYYINTMLTTTNKDKKTVILQLTLKFTFILTISPPQQQSATISNYSNTINCYTVTPLVDNLTINTTTTPRNIIVNNISALFPSELIHHTPTLLGNNTSSASNTSTSIRKPFYQPFTPVHCTVIDNSSMVTPSATMTTITSPTTSDYALYQILNDNQSNLTLFSESFAPEQLTAYSALVKAILQRVISQAD